MREQRERFQGLMRQFEQRGLDTAEVAMTYHHINRMLNAGNESTVPYHERLRLAEEMALRKATDRARLDLDGEIHRTLTRLIRATGLRARVRSAESESPADPFEQVQTERVIGPDLRSMAQRGVEDAPRAARPIPRQGIVLITARSLGGIDRARIETEQDVDVLASPLTELIDLVCDREGLAQVSGGWIGPVLDYDSHALMPRVAVEAATGFSEC